MDYLFCGNPFEYTNHNTLFLVSKHTHTHDMRDIKRNDIMRMRWNWLCLWFYIYIQTYVFSFYMFRYIQSIMIWHTNVFMPKTLLCIVLAIYSIFYCIRVSFIYGGIFIYTYVQNHAYTEKINHQRMRYPPQKHI